jgi:hypothetical protein
MGTHKRVPMPSRALAQAGKARLRLPTDMGTHKRVPMPSHALAQAGKARLRLRDHWGLKSSRVGACRMTEFFARRH